MVLPYDWQNGRFYNSQIAYSTDANSSIADNRVLSFTYSFNDSVKACSSNEYDTLKRLKTKEIALDEGSISFKKVFNYDKTRINSVVETLSDTNVGTENYTYDALGRISEYSFTSPNGNDYRKYHYDSLGQLVREDNAALDKTIVYCYNEAGNIVNTKTYGYTTSESLGSPIAQQSFAYDTTHPDMMRGIGTTDVGYDTSGYPTTYGSYNTAWTRGKLSRLSGKPSTTGVHCYYYTYNAQGQRTERSYTYTRPIGTGAVALGSLLNYNIGYTYDQSGRLISESKSSQYYGDGSTVEKNTYLYDETGIVGMVYTSASGVATTYYFKRNLLGDVIGIYNTGGTKVGGYAYDAWGNCTITLNTNGIATRNPIRYRGYYYDEDTKLYYLNARYYSPEWHRFISPDDTSYLDPDRVNGLNLYAYCNNDPVNYSDPSGHSLILTTALILMGVGATIGLGYAAYTDYSDDYDINGSVGWQTYVGSALIGGAIGFGIGYFGPSIASFLGSSFSFALPSFGALNMGGALALVGSTTITITGAQIAGGAIAATGIGIMLFSKGFGPRMGHNQHEKQMWNEAMNQLGITDKDLIQRLHHELHKYPYQDKLKGLLKVLREILAKWGKL